MSRTMFAEYDENAILRCPTCNAKIGSALVLRMGYPYVRFWAQYDDGITPRKPTDPYTIANEIIDCPTCGKSAYVVREQVHTAARFKLDRVQK